MTTAIISIRDRSWQVEVATTLEELSTGLGGRTSLDPGHGMLFDLGSNKSEILINMREMKFPIDIMFFSEDKIVQAMLWGLYPEDIEFLATFSYGPGARFFLEINEEELGDVTFGDQVVITGYTPSLPPAPPPDMDELMSPMIAVMMVVMIMGMAMKMMR